MRTSRHPSGVSIAALFRGLPSLRRLPLRNLAHPISHMVRHTTSLLESRRTHDVLSSTFGQPLRKGQILPMSREIVGSLSQPHSLRRRRCRVRGRVRELPARLASDGLGSRNRNIKIHPRPCSMQGNLLLFADNSFFLTCNSLVVSVGHLPHFSRTECSFFE